MPPQFPAAGPPSARGAPIRGQPAGKGQRTDENPAGERVARHEREAQGEDCLPAQRTLAAIDQQREAEHQRWQAVANLDAEEPVFLLRERKQHPIDEEQDGGLHRQAETRAAEQLEDRGRHEDDQHNLGIHLPDDTPVAGQAQGEKDEVGEQQAALVLLAREFHERFMPVARHGEEAGGFPLVPERHVHGVHRDEVDDDRHRSGDKREEQQGPPPACGDGRGSRRCVEHGPADGQGGGLHGEMNRRVSSIRRKEATGEMTNDEWRSAITQGPRAKGNG